MVVLDTGTKRYNRCVSTLQHSTSRMTWAVHRFLLIGTRHQNPTNWPDVAATTAPHSRVGHADQINCEGFPAAGRAIDGKMWVFAVRSLQDDLIFWGKISPRFVTVAPANLDLSLPHRHVARNVWLVEWDLPNCFRRKDLVVKKKAVGKNTCHGHTYRCCPMAGMRMKVAPEREMATQHLLESNAWEDGRRQLEYNITASIHDTASSYTTTHAQIYVRNMCIENSSPHGANGRKMTMTRRKAIASPLQLQHCIMLEEILITGEINGARVPRMAVVKNAHVGSNAQSWVWPLGRGDESPRTCSTTPPQLLLRSRTIRQRSNVRIMLHNPLHHANRFYPQHIQNQRFYMFFLLAHARHCPRRAGTPTQPRAHRMFTRSTRQQPAGASTLRHDSC